MLARTWSGSEATALWVELVAERKRDIEQNVDASQIQGMAARVAAQQEISRAELAKWDASARAWLLSADEVKIWEKTQLRLIMKDCGMLIGLHGSTYASVLDVWTVAMTSLEKLILGMPQRISKAALLIGISSWHIYPDLNVVGPTVNVKFKDGLIAPGGVITLGLSNASPNDDNGVQWSLSLSHLRFYGDPVKISTHADLNDFRITMDDLHIIALGSVLGNWGSKPGDLNAGVEWFVALRDCYNRGALETMKHRLPWLDFLCSTAKRYLETTSTAEQENQKFLLSYGRRKGSCFLTQDCTEPLFGLLDRELTADCSTDFSNTVDNVENLISRLRDLAKHCGVMEGQGFIAYYGSSEEIEIATAIPTMTPAKYIVARPQHYRWTSRRKPANDTKNLQAETYLRINGTDVRRVYASTMQSQPRIQWRYCPGEFFKDFDSHPAAFVAGDTTRAALYSTRAFESFPRYDLTYAELTHFFRSDRVLPWRIREILNGIREDTRSRYRADSPEKLMKWSLDVLLYATNVYNSFSGATISIRVVSDGLYNKTWAHYGRWDCPHTIPDHLTRALDFAVIAWFESGSLDLDLATLDPVMAIASGNSIFVTKALLQGPSNMGSNSIVRLLGNIGRPGVCILAPPQAPLIRPIDPGSWRLVNHFDFDGKVEHSFKDTSLHLSFTEYEVPLAVPVGAVDAEATMLETLVSVYDRDKWVADVDVLGALEKSFICSSTSDCLGEGPAESSVTVDDAALFIKDHSPVQVNSIDCWEELLDHPEGIGQSCTAVVRAGNNWNARVAAMCVSVQKGFRTQVLPIEKPLCINCSQSLHFMLKNTDVFIL